MTSSLIIGHRGQDGRLLGENLKKKGHSIFGIAHGDIDLGDFQAVQSLIERQKPDEIYFLAAFHQSSENKPDISDRELARKSFETHVLSLTNFLEAVSSHHPKARLFYAASSHVFGHPPCAPQNERTPFAPRNIYGITKAAGIEMCRYYRRQHGLHVSTGILYNHESTLRKSNFVSKKIVEGAVAIAKGKKKHLFLENLSARVDWGYAPDFVKAMRKILLLKESGDFIIATGILHSVQEFAEHAFKSLGLNWREHIQSGSEPAGMEKTPLVGDPALLKASTGWEASVSFEEMINILVKAEVDAA